jgi:hypothetical protein
VVGVISDVANGIITREWRTGFKWRKGDTGCLLENGVHNDDRELSSGDWGSNGERGSLFGSKSDMKLSGFKCGDQGSSARKKNICVGFQEKKSKKFLGFKKRKNNNKKKISSGVKIVRLFLVFNHSSP